MKYRGSFSTRKGKVEVEIVTDGNTDVVYSLGDGGPTAMIPGKPIPDKAGAEMYFDRDPVQISFECNDTFDVLMPMSASITLQARYFCRDLYKGDCRKARVKIKRGTEVLFAGMLSPMSYSQEFSGVADTLTLNCIDALSALQYVRFKDCGTDEADYDEVAASCSVRPLREILEEQIRLVTNMQITYRGIPLMKSGGISALDGISVNEALFIGESEDDVWTAQSVVEEILRYLDLHAIQYKGGIVIFPWSEVKQGSTEHITRSNAWGKDHSLSIGEVYNRISLMCEMEGEEELIPDILDESQLSSPFSAKQLFLREYSKKYDEEDISGYQNLIKGLPFPQTRGDSIWRRDWYVRFMQNPYWRFYRGVTPSDGAMTWDGSLPIGSSRDSLLYCTGAQTPATYQNRTINEVTTSRAAAIVKLSSGKQEYKESDNSVPNSLNETTTLIIGVCGDSASMPDDKQDNTLEGENVADWMKKACPRAVYAGPAQGEALSPVDEETTRYILIEGKLALAPWYKAAPWRSVQWAANNLTFLEFFYGFCYRAKMGDDSQRLYSREYLQAQLPGDTPNANMPGYNYANATPSGTLAAENADVDTFIAGPSGSLYTPFLNEEAARYFKYEYTRKESGDYESIDLCSKLGVLSCMLIVGDKCVVETGDGSAPENYEWRTFKTRSQCASMEEFLAQSFTIGIDPKKGDYIIGQEYDIANTVHYSRGIDGKGLAIPVRKSDEVSGQVQFLILGPYNLFWDNNVIYRHATLFRKEKFTPNGKYVLPYVNHIAVSDLSIRIVSDNGGDDPLEDRDLVYVSDTDETYVNEKDDLAFKICSALTAEERRQFGTRDTRSLGTAIDNSTGLGVLSVYNPEMQASAKPEQFYVDAAWRECHKPKAEISQTIDETRLEADIFKTYHHPGTDTDMYPIGITWDLAQGSATLKLREV